MYKVGDKIRTKTGKGLSIPKWLQGKEVLIVEVKKRSLIIDPMDNGKPVKVGYKNIEKGKVK